MEISIKYEHFPNWRDLPENDFKLIQEAISISQKAYAVYSQFHVGASLLLENGLVVTGSNQENIAYPSGLCAERTALFYAGAQYPELRILKLAVYGAGDLMIGAGPVPPCGSCRQVIAESIKRQQTGFELFLVGQNSEVLYFKNAIDLLPLPFGV
jgi:cytidine deaminase